MRDGSCWMSLGRAYQAPDIKHSPLKERFWFAYKVLDYSLRFIPLLCFYIYAILQFKVMYRRNTKFLRPNHKGIYQSTVILSLTFANTTANASAPEANRWRKQRIPLISPKPISSDDIWLNGIVAVDIDTVTNAHHNSATVALDTQLIVVSGITCVL